MTIASGTMIRLGALGAIARTADGTLVKIPRGAVMLVVGIMDRDDRTTHRPRGTLVLLPDMRAVWVFGWALWPSLPGDTVYSVAVVEARA